VCLGGSAPGRRSSPATEVADPLERRACGRIGWAATVTGHWVLDIRYQAFKAFAQRMGDPVRSRGWGYLTGDPNLAMLAM